MRRPALAILLATLLPAAAACSDGNTNVDAPPQPTVVPSTSVTASASAEAPKPSKYPATAKKAVTNEYHGTKVVDEYQWLEKSDDAEVKSWVDAQNKATRDYFAKNAQRAKIRERIKGILTSSSPDRFALHMAKDTLFALKDQPPKQQPFLVVMTAPDKAKTEADLKERVIVDPNVIDPKGRTTIDWYQPSPDGKLVAVSMSEGGTENGTVHVFDVETGKEQGDLVPYAHSGTAGGALTWAGDGKGFYYTRHPHKGEVDDKDMGFFQQVYFHKLGTKFAEDKPSLTKDKLVRIAEIELKTSKDGKWVYAPVQNGDGGEYWHFILDTKSGQWTRFADLPDRVVGGKFGPDNKLYLLSVKDAPKGKILRIDPAKPDLAKAETIVAHSDVTIEGYVVTKSKVYVKDLVGGPSQVRIFDQKGKVQGTVPIPPVSSVRQLVPMNGDDILFRGQSYTTTPAWYSYKPSAKTPVEKTVMATTSSVNFDDAEAVREMCTSKDGTKVPINILRKKGTKLDGSNALLLSGYGGYGISLQPGVNPLLRVWLDMGGVFAVANLRGGGEFGEEWHRAGNLAKKQNVFDDFYACAKHAVDTKITSPQKLAIIGGSNGGLLMGAAAVQHPEMYKAVVSYVGIYDMLRVELTTNGAFNTTEFGSVKDPEMFKALYAYSPLHNVKDGVAYPPIFFLTGANDPRVDPWQSRKMTARLQAASTGGMVLLRASDNTGHGGGTPLDDEIEEQADVYSFLANELGLTAP
ncbi:MAG: S9 family peptidase [Polyangiaceae bacterium]|nr:S9 family peptidase [Polyangiaceae bacterium]